MTRTDARKLSPDAQEDLRRRTVAAVQNGMTITQAAETFGVSREAIYRWRDAAATGGSAALKAKKRGRPKGSRLAGHQAGTIVRLITESCPDQLQFPFALWTREAVGQLIERRYKIRLSVWTVGRYLKHWGFTPQKPVRRAYERNPEAVRRWLDEDYPAIRNRAKRENAEIHWGDEMGLRSDHQTGRSYSPRGKTPVIPGTGKRFGCNVLSTITNRGKLAFMVFKVRFTARVMIDFLRRLLRHSKRKVFLILDGHPVHRSRRISEWLKQNQARIRMFLLPGYSPELNPDELLNQDVKSNALGRRRPKDQPELIRDVRGYLRGTQKQPQIVRNYFREKHVAYAAD